MLTVIIKGREIVVHDEERQPCECWTRVMGYFRPVSDWNIGKKGEHADRRNGGLKRVPASIFEPEQKTA